MENEHELEKIVGTEVVGLLKCNICWDIFTEPTILPCGHTFCMGCLNEIGRHRSKNTKTAAICDVKILCPNCRHCVLLDDVNKLRNGVRLNYALNSIKETLANFQSAPKVDAATNTETDAVLDEKLKTIEQNINTAFCQLKKRGNVLHGAFSDIAKIREGKALKSDRHQGNNRSVNPTCRSDEGFNILKSKLNVNQPEFVPRNHVNVKHNQKTRGNQFYDQLQNHWNHPFCMINQYHYSLPLDPAIVSIYGPPR